LANQKLDEVKGAIEKVETAIREKKEGVAAGAALAPGAPGGGITPSATAAEHSAALRIGPPPAATGEMTAYLREKLGYSPTQAASLIGQLTQESALDPNAVDKTGAHHGMAQWDAERFAQLKTFAGGQGKNWQDWQTQLDFANKEIHEKAPSFFNAPGIPEQSAILTKQFEKPGNYDYEIPRRTALAQQALPIAERGGTAVADQKEAADRLKEAAAALKDTAKPAGPYVPAPAGMGTGLRAAATSDMNLPQAAERRTRRRRGPPGRPRRRDGGSGHRNGPATRGHRCGEASQRPDIRRRR
jgi:hypothetical protein